MDTVTQYPNLLSPLKLGDLELKNRVFMAPMTRARGPGGVANEHVAEYYGQRASAGLIISEGTHISAQAVGWCNVPGIYTNEQQQAWKVRRRGVRLSARCAWGGENKSGKHLRA